MATARALSSARSTIASFAPSAANSSAVARPIPDPLPVINAIFPSSLPIFSLTSFVSPLLPRDIVRRYATILRRASEEMHREVGERDDRSAVQPQRRGRARQRAQQAVAPRLERNWRLVAARLLQEHHPDWRHVVVEPNRRIQNPDHRQHVESRTDDRGKDIELADETDGRGDARQRKQEDSQRD